MTEFANIACSQGMEKVYRRIVNTIDPQNHPDFLNRPMKVLDIGGGTGIIGNQLKLSLSESLGELTGEDFAQVVDYVNLDTDRDALTQSSVGRTFWRNAAYMYDDLRNETPFDYILYINANPVAKVYTPEILDRMGIEDGLFGYSSELRAILLQSPHQIRGYMARITLMGAALLLQEFVGQFIHVGFTTDDVMQGMTQTSRKYGLGLEIASDEKIEIDEETAKLFVEVDTGSKRGERFKELVELYQNNYRLLLFKQTGLPTRSALTAHLTNQVKEYRDWVNSCEAQERFWN